MYFLHIKFVYVKYSYYLCIRIKTETMLGTVSNLTIDLSRLETIWLGYKEDEEGSDWRDLVVLRLKPTIQYAVNPVTGGLDAHTVESPIVEQRCIDQDSQKVKYNHWVKLWEEYLTNPD